MKASKNTIGLLLFALYLLQFLAQVDFEYLENLQRNATYRHWSGFALFLLLLYQWVLPIYRGVFDIKGKTIEKMVMIHNWLGMVLPLGFYLHSTQPGYGLLLILTLVFFLNLLMGLLINHKAVKTNLEYFRLGIATHIFLSAAVMILALIHIWIVFFYN